MYGIMCIKYIDHTMEGFEMNTDYNGATFNVKFLDTTYDIPEDVIIFLNCRDFVSKGLVKLLNEASSLMSKYTRIGGKRAVDGMADDVTHIQQVMKFIVKDVHDNLLKRGIYDVDQKELYERITSIKQVDSMATEIALNALSAVMEVQSENQAMRDYAYRSAASNITGSGVTIFTNNLASLMVHSAIENSVLKSQAKKADQEYEQALRKISASAVDRFERIHTDVLFNQFLPKLPDIFTKFHDELLSNYLLELSTHNQFNPDALEKYSENKSSTMLENIKHAEDKQNLLQQAFAECPFNLDIYEKLLQLGYFDFDTFIDAKKIFKKSEMDNLLEEKIKSNLNDMENVKKYVKVLASYKNKDESSVLSMFYQDTISKIKNDYHEIFLVCVDSRRLSTWIKDHINKDRDKIASTSEESIRDKISTWIKNTVDDKQYENLSAMGLISIDDIKYKDSTKNTLAEVQTEYVDKMIALILDYIKELGKKKIAYEEAYDKYNAGLKKHTDAIAAKNDELKQQGLFAFSKKKELKAELDRLNNEYEEYRRTEPVNLKNAYFNM